LANLRADRAHVPDRPWWRWTVVSSAIALATVIILMAALFLRSGPRHAPVIANHNSPTAPGVEQPVPRVAPKRADGDAHSSTLHTASRRGMREARSATMSAAYPKLGQFPSPRPLSEQERILASYVEKYPDQAALLAQARTEALRRDELEEMQAFPSSGWATDSDERNNDKTNR